MFRTFSLALLLAALCGARAESTNQAPVSTNHPAIQPSFNTLTPEQRAARIQELRQKHGYSNAPVNLTPDERRARMKKRLEELRRKQAEGTLTPAETKQLEILQRSTNHPLPALKLHPSTNTVTTGTNNLHLLSK